MVLILISRTASYTARWPTHPRDSASQSVPHIRTIDSVAAGDEALVNIMIYLGLKICLVQIVLFDLNAEKFGKSCFSHGWQFLHLQKKSLFSAKRQKSGRERHGHPGPVCFYPSTHVSQARGPCSKWGIWVTENISYQTHQKKNRSFLTQCKALGVTIVLILQVPSPILSSGVTLHFSLIESLLHW